MWNDHKEAISDEYPTHKLVMFQLPPNLNHIGYHLIISQPLSHGHQSELNETSNIGMFNNYHSSEHKSCSSSWSNSNLAFDKK